MGGATDHRLATQVPSGEPFDLHTWLVRTCEGVLQRQRQSRNPTAGAVGTPMGSFSSTDPVSKETVARSLLGVSTSL